MSISIVLAEDHKIVREGTRQLLEQYPDLRIVGEAENGAQAVQLAKEMQPDVVVIDVRMPVVGGLEATRLIKANSPGTHILALSAYDDDQYVFPLLEAGASGYLLKTASGAELAEAIRTISQGGTALSSRIAGKVVDRLAKRPPYHTAEMNESLTEREMDVLQLAAHGKSNKDIALALSIRPQTVQVHLRNIFGKLQVSSRSQAVAFAIRHGWITLELGNE